MERKLFSVSEANRALPRLGRILSALKECFDWLEEHRPPPIYAIAEYRVANEGPVDPEYFRTLMRMRRCLREIGQIGVQLKDVRTGLVDFPARLHGREVLLCWRLGEEKVRFWHDLESGFAGRQPLPERAEESGGADDEGIH